MRRGFTLVELLIVIIIIGVIAAIAIPSFASRTLAARESALRSNLKQVRGAIERFRADTGLWPAVLGDLLRSNAPANGLNNGGQPKPIAAGSFRGPYLHVIPGSPIPHGRLEYGVTPPSVGNVAHPPGRASDGTDYSDW